jgi:hypothetical protein
LVRSLLEKVEPKAESTWRLGWGYGLDSEGMVHPGPHPGKDLREPQGAPLIAPLRYALSKNIPTKGPLNRRSLHCAPPDFLLRPVALINIMRFS